MTKKQSIRREGERGRKGGEREYGVVQQREEIGEGEAEKDRKRRREGMWRGSGRSNLEGDCIKRRDKIGITGIS